MAIAEGLSLPTELLYQPAGILEEQGLEVGSLEDAIRSDAALTEKQVRALEEMYRAFRQFKRIKDENSE